MQKIAETIVAWLQDYATQAGASGYVVGLSGGIDSATTAALCQRAVGERVLGVLMPCHSRPGDAEMALLVAAAFSIPTVTVDLGTAYDAMVAALPSGLNDLAMANIKPRLRMAALYALAQTHAYLVAGTGNASELMVGYFTKFGDGGVDIEPLGDLYKREVYDLAHELGVPQPIIERPPTAGLWAGQTDEEEMGLSYDALERALIALSAGGDREIEGSTLAQVRRMVASSEHKRAMPPAFVREPAD